MSLTISITIPRVTVPAGTKPLLRTLLPFAAAAVLAAADATGVGLIGRILLGTALKAAEEALDS